MKSEIPKWKNRVEMERHVGFRFRETIYIDRKGIEFEGSN